MSRRTRRGATMVLVAICTVAFVSIAALAIEFTRFSTGIGEVQTAADASALRGALRIQRIPGLSPVDSVVAFAGLNGALGARAALATTDVLPKYYNPLLTPAERDTTWGAANAVSVLVKQPTNLLFKNVLSGTTAQRRAVAWVANVTGKTCDFKPIAMPMATFFGSDTLTQTMVSTMLADTSDAAKKSRTRVMLPYSPSNDPGPSTFLMIADTPNKYADQLSRGGGCAADSSIASGVLEPFPGKGLGAITKNTVEGFAGIKTTGTAVCTFAGGLDSNDATCTDAATGAAGSRIWVAYTVTADASCKNKDCTIRTLMVGAFRLMCVFSGKPNNTQPDAAESCPWLSGTGLPTSNYDPGTLVGYPEAGPVGLDGNTTLGSIKSINQRLILVK